MGDFNSHHPVGGREIRWLTPLYITKALGEFDLDPCGAPGHVLAKRTFLLENGEDGLLEDWVGRVWLNPPYGKYAVPFLERMALHGQGTALLFARTDTSWFHRLVFRHADAIMFLKGRIQFLRADGSRGRYNAGAPSCLVAWGGYDVGCLERSGLPGEIVYLNEGGCGK